MSTSSVTNIIDSSSATSRSSETESDLIKSRMQSHCPPTKKRKEDTGEIITCHQDINSVKNITSNSDELNTTPIIGGDSNRLNVNNNNNNNNKSQNSTDTTSRQGSQLTNKSEQNESTNRVTNHPNQTSTRTGQTAIVKLEVPSKISKCANSTPAFGSNNFFYGSHNQNISYKTRPLLINHASSTSSSSAPSSTSVTTDKNQASSGNQNPKSSDTTNNRVPSQLPQTATIIPGVSSQLIQTLITTQAKQPYSLNCNDLKTTTNIQQNKPINVNSHESSVTTKNPIKTTSTTTTITETKTTKNSSAIESKTPIKQRNSASPSNVNQLAAPGSAGNAAAARLIDMGKRLLEAARQGHTDQVRHLVVNSGAPFTSDSFGTTALHIAAQNGSIEIAEILLRGGVNKDAKTKLERTALHLAAQSGSLEIANLLLNYGVDVNARDMLKMTPLHWAVQRGHMNVIERLLIAGADVNMRSKFQLTPIDIARDSELYDVVELFKNWTNGQASVFDESSIENSFRNIESNSSGESHNIFDIGIQLSALVDGNASSRSDPMLDIDENEIDFDELEWNKLDFGPDFFLANDSEDEPNVECLMKMVEELQKENKQLRQRVERLSTTNR